MSDNTNWSELPKRSGRVSLFCIQCGAAFSRVPFALKRGAGRGKYCSASCRGKAGASARTNNLKPMLQDRFTKNINKSDCGCWLWTGPTTRSGYGSVTRGNRTLRVHRYMYELEVGPIPNGLHVLHTCDVRSCCNPDHLWLGTHAQNMADMAKKGRSRPPYSRMEQSNV